MKKYKNINAKNINDSIKYIRVPINDKMSTDKTKVIKIDMIRGISAIYSANRKIVLEYHFLKTNNKWVWIEKDAKLWVKSYIARKERLRKKAINKELRCVKNNKLLAELSISSNVEIKCNKCKTFHRYIQGTSMYKDEKNNWVEYSWI